MNLIDVHCHLNHAQFKEDLPEVIKRAQEVGIKVIIVSGVNTSANHEVLKLAEKYPLIKASLGIYPIDALGLSEGETGLPRQPEPINLEEEFKFIEKNKDKIISIGEIGMDFHWASKEATGEKQADNFRKIINFAKRINKPVVIHSRKAEAECIQILQEEISTQEIPVIMHCFSGKKILINQAAALDHYFSIPPNIVKSDQFQTLVKIVPLTQLLTETDSPWLSPIKEQRNEPSFVIETIRKIAEIKQLTPEQVAVQIWENYQKAFLQK
ncbi:TatD family hydrolase [Candidatus Woesearchaeota archaeon]|nr:TatD family hydrolase [Candidatus Woesearchaeota archaeon]